MKNATTKPGHGNGGKTNYVFPPFPQPLLLLTNYEKAATKKTSTIVYTKSLALPRISPGRFATQ
jgi:hypothetical protein